MVSVCRSGGASCGSEYGGGGDLERIFAVGGSKWMLLKWSELDFRLRKVVCKFGRLGNRDEW